MLFDHDGTLVDSLAGTVAATNRALTRHGYAERPYDEVVAGMAHPTAPRMGLHAAVDDPARQRELAEAFYIAVHEVGPALARLYAGVREALAALAAAGLARGVISNNQGRYVRRVLDHLGVAAHFGCVIGEEDMPAPKPHPGGLQRAAERLGAESACYVGDSPVDAAAAAAAGMPSIGVTWGIHRRADMTTMGFTVLVDAPAELPGAVDRLLAPR